MEGVLREIKFRVWNRNKKSMSQYIILGDEIIVYKDLTTEPIHKAYMTIGNELMQYTGLKDKNNVDIYEGDILKFVSQSFLDSLSNEPMKERIKPIVWNEDKLCFWVAEIDNGFQPSMEVDNNRFEVIGNIYENKNLLT